MNPIRESLSEPITQDRLEKARNKLLAVFEDDDIQVDALHGVITVTDYGEFGLKRRMRFPISLTTKVVDYFSGGCRGKEPKGCEWLK